MDLKILSATKREGEVKEEEQVLHKNQRFQICNFHLLTLHCNQGIGTKPKQCYVH
ncbi:hypothetical protein BRARA_J01288 [Brassica rapa]|uniref:Uncharacterized protein n=1 Tax=Brassica campestris TaxID=3711 RepID=A0A397XSZ7_BRACM|nr:hypothetical protein BRARA_J01288 [Brassica rapa]